jgi:hypothetical protein
MSERTRRSHGGGNLPPPRMSELARIHLYLPAPCSRLCTPPVPVEVPVDVPHVSLPHAFRLGDMAASRANACPPNPWALLTGGTKRSERVRAWAWPRGSASGLHPPTPAGRPARTYTPCVEGDERAHALRTPRWPHTRVCGHICAGQVRTPLRRLSGPHGGALGSGCIRARRLSNSSDSARNTCPKRAGSCFRS